MAYVIKDICTPRKGRDKTYWHKIGTAFVDGDKIGLQFDSLPIPDAEGKCSAQIFDRRTNDERPPHPAKGMAANGRNVARDDLDDGSEIPF